MSNIFEQNKKAVNEFGKMLVERVQRLNGIPLEDAPMEYVTLQVFFVGRVSPVEYTRVWKSDVVELEKWLRGDDEWYVVNTDNAVVHLAMKRIEAISVIDEATE